MASPTPPTVTRKCLLSSGSREERKQYLCTTLETCSLTVSAAEETTEIWCLHSEWEEVTLQTGLVKVQKSLLCRSQCPLPSPPDLSASSDVVVHSPFLGHLLGLALGTPGSLFLFLTSHAAISRFLAGSSLFP